MILLRATWSTNSLLVATLSSPSLNSSVLLLPDTYSSSSSSLPTSLLSVLQSPLTTLSLPSPTFLNSTSASGSTLNLPLTLAQSSPLITFPNANFSGPGGSYTFPTGNASFTPQVITLDSLSLSSGVWAAFSTNSSTTHLIVWESVADFTQMGSQSEFPTSSPVNLISLQSSSCSTPCSSAGTCLPGGTCQCPANFAGSSCETCASGFFGPTCQACPSDCEKCDDGPSGSGACLSGITSSPPSSCNCANGVCASGGSCTCTSGWATDTSQNSTQCSVCAAGFFTDGDGNCQACQLGCTSCQNGSGTCTACRSGLQVSSSSPNQCVVPTSSTTCSDGTFNNAGTCTQCSSLCKTCTGPLSTDCIICAAGQSSLNNQCVSIDSNGVCSPASSTNTSMIANNAKNLCDTCPLGCTACGISGFSVVSTIGQAECTKCLPGLVLSGGRCVSACPSGSFVDPNGDGFTCTACDASCGTCAGSSTHCLTCTQSGFSASNGTCVSSCPSSSFASGGACVPCHSDCLTCNGSGFNQCISCSSSRPVLSASSGGRCLLTCGKSQFYDSSSGGTGACTNCDSSCSTCAGSGSSNCLTCPTGRVLRNGVCVDAKCPGGDDVGSIAALGGICLSSFVNSLPQASSITITSPTSTVTIVSPGSTPASSSGVHLTVWEIILMALGIMGLAVLSLILWRRAARRARAQETQAFREAKLEKPGGILAWFGFGGKSASKRARRKARGRNGSLSTLASKQSGIDGWRYEMETVEQGMARRRSSVLHSPISDRFTIQPTDVRSRKQQYRGASVYSAASGVSAFTSPSSPRERDEYGNAVGLQPRDARRLSASQSAWTAPSEYSQPSQAVGSANRYKRSSPPPPVPELGTFQYEAPYGNANMATPQPRQPIKDTSVGRFGSAGGGGVAPDLFSTGLFATPTGSSGGIGPVQPNYRGQPLAQIQPLVDVPLVDDPTGSSGRSWSQAVDQMPSNSASRGDSKNPFRNYL
ncbi:growth factor receptor domain-containing protein [Clavulina sp. PMI_390]|nr:growth factor receptor domain-containing protein [Clavulina sp. PMI_390]